ncbi:MAG: GNAT family N-acetyltransferase [Clostridia bacterium]|nr:GNAT family N-acetyltransferase [Clostridia bacterium]
MLNHMGTQIIETPRLILRRFKIEDAEQMYNNWASDPVVTKYLSWGAHKNISETKEIISSWVSDYENKNCYNWCITIKPTGEAVGGISTVKMFEHADCCEIGYVLSRKLWNKGIMTEVLRAVLEYLFEKVGFHRIQLKHDVENIASGKVMIKNGLKREGIIRECEKTASGDWRDMMMYSVLYREFKDMQK